MEETHGAIVYIDDSATAREVVKQALSEAGYQVFACAHWEDMLAAMSELQPELALVDVQMPGVSGAPVAYLLKRYFPRLRVVFYSNCREETLQELVGESQADGYMQKTDSAAEIVAAVERFLAQEPETD